MAGTDKEKTSEPSGISRRKLEASQLLFTAIQKRNNESIWLALSAELLPLRKLRNLQQLTETIQRTKL